MMLRGKPLVAPGSPLDRAAALIAGDAVTLGPPAPRSTEEYDPTCHTCGQPCDMFERYCSDACAAEAEDESQIEAERMDRE